MTAPFDDAYNRSNPTIQVRRTRQGETGCETLVWRVRRTRDLYRYGPILYSPITMDILMAKLPIVTPWDQEKEILYESARRVREFGPMLHTLLDNMAETIREARGVGLAAPQVGLDLRITVIEYPEDEDKPEETMRLYELINPEIIKSKGSEVAQEGCLSLPGLAADVERATYVLVKAQDRQGKEFRMKAYDWLARIVQHEVDHLQGVLMTDRAEQVYKMRENEDGEVELIPIESALPTA